MLAHNLKVTAVITGKLCLKWSRLATCIIIYEMAALEVVQNGYMYHYSRDGNFIGLFTIPSSTSNKISTNHSSKAIAALDSVSNFLERESYVYWPVHHLDS